MLMYVEDTTVHPPKVVRFNEYNTLVKYLEEVCIRANRMTRKQRMDELVSLGHGYDDSNAVNFVRSMQDQFNIGTIKQDKFARCDVPTAVLFNKDEYGD